MGMLDNMKEKAQELMGQHKDKVEEYSDQGIDKAGDAVDQATGGTYAGQVDQAQQLADDKIGDNAQSTADHIAAEHPDSQV